MGWEIIQGMPMQRIRVSYPRPLQPKRITVSAGKMVAIKRPSISDTVIPDVYVPELTDGTETWRLIADDDEAFNWQHTLTATAFDGTEDIDYYTPQEIE